MGGEALARLLLPPAHPGNVQVFLRPVQPVQRVLTKEAGPPRHPAPNARPVTAAVRRVMAAYAGWGVPGGGSLGADAAVSDDLMQKYRFTPQRVNYASFTHFCSLLLPPSLLLL